MKPFDIGTYAWVFTSNLSPISYQKYWNWSPFLIIGSYQDSNLRILLVPDITSNITEVKATVKRCTYADLDLGVESRYVGCNIMVIDTLYLSYCGGMCAKCQLKFDYLYHEWFTCWHCSL